ncbi:MAG: hypothetical protein RJP95_01155 [Pirellulales bacterium]
MPISPEKLAEFRRKKAFYESLVSSEEFRRNVVEPVSELLLQMNMMHEIEIEEIGDGRRWAYLTKGHLGVVSLTVTPNVFAFSQKPAVVQIQWEHDGGTSLSAACIDDPCGIAMCIIQLHSAAESAREELDEFETDN